MTSERPANFATYLDEAGDDPQQAAEVVSSHGIKNICLRRAWGHPVTELQDGPLTIIKETLDNHRISVACLCGTSGDTMDEKRLKHDVVLAQFFGSKRLRVNWRSTTMLDTHKWLDLISENTLLANIQPVIEPVKEWQPNATALAALLAKYKRLGLIYDAAGLLARGSMHPLVYIWSLLKSRVQIFDIRDFIQGIGPRPVGNGECKIDLTLVDAFGCDYRGWYCLEPGLGPRYSSFQTRAATFGCALEAFDKLWSTLRSAYGSGSKSGNTTNKEGGSDTCSRSANAGPERTRWVAENRTIRG